MCHQTLSLSSTSYQNSALMPSIGKFGDWIYNLAHVFFLSVSLVTQICLLPILYLTSYFNITLENNIIYFHIKLIKEIIAKYHTPVSTRAVGRRVLDESIQLRLTERHFLNFIPSTAQKRSTTKRWQFAQKIREDANQDICVQLVMYHFLQFPVLKYTTQKNTFRTCYAFKMYFLCYHICFLSYFFFSF